MRKLKLLFSLCALVLGGLTANAEDEDYTSRITNANMASKDGWTVSATGGNWSDVKGSSPSYVLEAYAGWGSLALTAYSIKQNVTLPSGKYRAEGYAFYRYGAAADTDASKSYAKFVAGDFSASVVTLGGETLDGTLTAYPNSMDEASAAFTNGYYKSVVNFSIESEQAIPFGYEGTHVEAKSWFICGPIKLYRTGDFDYSLYQSQLESLVADAKALQGKTMAASISSALNTVILTYDGQTCASVAAYNTAYDALNTAIANAEKSIASYAIIASGKVATDVLAGWTCTNTNDFHINTWSSEGNPGNDPSGMTTPFIENWVAKGTYLGEGTFSYTLECLEPGEVYYAQALIRSYNEKDATAPNGPTFFVNSSETSLATEGTTFTYKGMSGIYATLGAAATVGNDGKITLGAKIAADANYNWVAFKDVSILPMSVALATVVSEAEALYASLPTAAKNTLKAVVDANKDDSSFSTAAQYETAIGNINTAKDVANSFMSPYSVWKTVKGEAETLFVGYDAMLTLIATNSTAVENADDPAIITAKKDEIQNAINAYGVYTETTTVATALGVNVADVTGYSTSDALQKAAENLTVAVYTAADAYALDMTSQLGVWTNAPGKNHGESWNGTTGDGSDEYYDEYNKADRAMSQEITLPAGCYVLIAKGRASVNGLLTLTDGTNTVTFPHKSSTGRGIATDGTATFDAGATYANNNNGRGWEYRVLPFISDGTTPITLTFNWKTSGSQWIGLDDIVLKQKAESVTVTAAGYATYVSDQPLDFTSTDIKAYTAKVNAGKVVLTQINKVPANTPVVLYKEGGATESIPVATTTDTPAASDLVSGTGAAVATDGGTGYTNYILNNVSGIGFYLAAGQAVAKNRAYLHVADADKAAAPALTIVFDGDATGINLVQGEGLKVNGEVYDLQGCKVAKPAKGLYIVNGKKVMVK